MNKFLEDIHIKVMSLLTVAEKMQLDAYYGDIKVLEKAGIQDTTSIVTETDYKIDEYLRTNLKQTFPDFGFITEESDHKPSGRLNWIIDPIDGTLNFAKKIPIFGISIALWDKNDPLYGVVSLPLIKIRLHSLKGLGAFYNGKKFSYKTYKKIKHPYIYFGHVGSKEEKIEITKLITNLYSFPRGIGCAVFYGVMAILGRADCSVLINLPLWDIAAIIAIASEANCGIKYLTPKIDIIDGNFAGYKNSILIGQPKIIQEVSSKLISLIGKKKQ